MLDTFKNLEKCNCSKTRLLGKVYKAGAKQNEA